MAKKKIRFLDRIFPKAKDTKETVHPQKIEEDYSEHASLAALAPIIKARGIFQAIHQKVEIDQKTIDYSPTDKLVFVILMRTYDFP